MKLEQCILKKMLLIRRVEEAIARHYADQQMRCPTHLSIGQEGPAAAAAMCLRPTDYCVSTHRSHAHYLALGGDLKAMMSELYGKSSGCSKGRGGSMHLIDEAVGFMGSTAIVGNSIPVGLGLAKAIELDSTDAVSAVFLGDAAVETGVFYESANFAAVAKLPLVFLCENNLYSVYTGMEHRQPKSRTIHDLASSIGLKSWNVSGNDPILCHRAIAAAIEVARAGEGPCFVEMYTYRWREHCGPNYDDDLGYRSPEEVSFWNNQDPIENLLSLECMRDFSTEDYTQLLSVIDAEIFEAFEYAQASPFPSKLDAHLYQYKQ